MGTDKKYSLGEFEELVLLAIIKLNNHTYGVPIREELEAAGRAVTVGALYTTLDRLADKGYIKSRDADPTPERGNRVKRYFKVTGLGVQALRQAELARRSLVPSLKKALA
ncbi:MAG TPA: helix-turn-helix transcriptional regulator [Blastocatellia bacterium]|nr:helix-turn-helix transcriptional regulator [Blastocatellia bacterium]